ncbi:MATE family efflux transporter [Halioxenophilus sp. WMMB6]|uniref:MATE family efflux transporter n=1 Tax=Halioxenophilus sp. WMMB6 TaxID=3073815 RepID=UPI00295E8E9D|nr:MATE family efflux transporter [Halioxenophilus sp. WMMB6]
MSRSTVQEALIVTRLGLPLIISHMAIIGMAATDTIFSGLVSTENLAGLSIAASIWSGLSVFILGMCGATVTIAAQLHGGGRFSRIGFQVHQTAWIGFATAACICLLLATSQWWLRALQPPGPVTEIAWRYLTILTLGCFGFVLTAVMQGACEAVGDTTLAMITNIGLFLLNALFDYSLVFGHFGLPQLGAIGCAWASVLAYWLVAIALALYLQSRASYRRYHLFTKAWMPHAKSIRKQLGLSLPLAIGAGGEVFFFSSIALTLAPFGPIALASHQVVFNFSAIVYMIPLGLSVAVCIRVAQLRGAGQEVGAVFSAFTGTKVAVCIAAVTALLTILARHWIAERYSPDQEVQAIAAQLLLICALYQLFDGLQVSSWGGLRGFGDTKIPMLLQLTAYWLCGFPIGLLLAHGLQLGVYGFWLGIVCGLMTAAVLLHTRLHIISRRFASTAALQQHAA